MISNAVSFMVARKLGSLTLPGQLKNGHVEGTCEGVFDAFEKGVRAGSKAAAASEVRRLEADLPWDRWPFFWEGHGFGIAARHALTLSRGHPADRRISDERFSYMFYTGLGFYNAVARRHFMPRVNLEPGAWSGVSDYAFRGPMSAGGDAFVHAVERGEYDPSDLARVTVPKGADWRALSLVGIGRALWFVYMGNFEGLASVLARHPDDAGWIASGLGLAITYTQMGTPERILPALASLPPRYAPDLVRGCLVALYGWGDDDPRSHARLEALPEPLPDWWRRGHASMELLPKDESWHRQLEGHGKELARELADRDLSAVRSA